MGRRRLDRFSEPTCTSATTVRAWKWRSRIRPLRGGDVDGFTLTVHDVATHRAWEEYRETAARAQATLQQAADDAQERLATLESLTDPSLNPLGGSAMVAELLERLRATTRADGVALLQSGRVAGGVVAARGLRPTGRVE